MFFLLCVLAILTIFLLLIMIGGLFALMFHIAKQAITITAKIGLVAVSIFAFVFIFFCVLTFLVLILGFLFVPF